MTFNEILEKVEKATSNEELFEIWQAAHLHDTESFEKFREYNGNISNKSFTKDGIVSKDEFSQKIKVLYILNESNINGYTDKLSSECFDSTKDFIEFAEEGKDWGTKLKEKICSLQKHMLEGNGVFLGDVKDYAKTISFINLNKRGGGNLLTTEYFNEYFMPYVKTYAPFIKRQIEIINPDFIVWLSAKTSSLRKFVVPDGLKNNYKVIPFKHPSCRLGIIKYLDEFKKLYMYNPKQFINFVAMESREAHYYPIRVVQI